MQGGASHTNRGRFSSTNCSTSARRARHHQTGRLKCSGDPFFSSKDLQQIGTPFIRLMRHPSTRATSPEVVDRFTDHFLSEGNRRHEAYRDDVLRGAGHILHLLPGGRLHLASANTGHRSLVLLIRAELPTITWLLRVPHHLRYSSTFSVSGNFSILSGFSVSGNFNSYSFLVTRSRLFLSRSAANSVSSLVIRSRSASETVISIQSLSSWLLRVRLVLA